uniref:Uncharacterized protein n=1 Tax=Strombidium inclinatum TaxID=197538 RepID=A0A7S3IUH6_9SPIT|mmetsp:Transcript_41445/g.63233  ORF Transcript_41445/g.63233 Transcript_41445/m.63233 type:complete len:110 (+) Transcript_41445:741-1070(+)
METPAPYNSVKLEQIKNRTAQWKIPKPKEDKPDNKIHKDNSPSPVHYQKEKAFDKTQQRRVVEHSFSKAEKKTFTDRDIKKAKVVPGIGAYDITKSDKVMTLGARRSYK